MYVYKLNSPPWSSFEKHQVSFFKCEFVVKQDYYNETAKTKKKLQENFSPKHILRVSALVHLSKFEMNYVNTGFFVPQCGITTFNLKQIPNVPNETYDHIHAHILERMEEGINGYGLSEGDDGELM